MTSQQLEHRLTTLEQEIVQVKLLLQSSQFSPIQAEIKWWEKISGSAADDPTFDEAERLRQEWCRTAE